MSRVSMKLACLFLFASIAVGCHREVVSDEPELSPPTFTIQSAVLKEARRINVYRPPGYTAVQSFPCPVLYMLDGGEQEDFPHVVATVDAAIQAGEMRPFIVVGIENTERRRDVTGPTEVDEDRKIAPRVGGSAAFRAFIRDELMPEVRSRYNLTGETAIIGESLAGLFIVETFFLQPEMFDTYIALSPSLWWNDEELVRKASERIKARSDLRKVLYLSSANEDNIAPAAARLADILRKDAPPGLHWQYAPRPDLRHDNIYRESSPVVLRSLFAPEAQAHSP